MAKVLITGGTGLIGRYLQALLLEKGQEVVILTRNPKKENEFAWDIPNSYIQKEAFNGVTHIIHLAGAGIADKRWLPKRKRAILNSRVQSANLIFKKIKHLNIPLKNFISASGIGYYGAITNEHVHTENDKPHTDYIAKVCIAWENAAKQFKTLNIPVTIFRTGVVLAKDGGALKKMNTPFLLSAIASGKQYLPWIHIKDLCNLYLKAVEDSNFDGVYNAVAPEQHTNFSFMKQLALRLKKWLTPINIPAFMMRILVGKLAVILINGVAISSKKTEKIFNFKYPTLASALQNIYQNE